jgi:hypothetical protein
MIEVLRCGSERPIRYWADPIRRAIETDRHTALDIASGHADPHHKPHQTRHVRPVITASFRKNSKISDFR